MTFLYDYFYQKITNKLSESGELKTDYFLNLSLSKMLP